ncbi:MAG: hypothetical protein IPO16_07310 [Saprospiraceae bacterium]|nr:hypothetical protein [Saprospiraceae bacterium]
MKKNNNRPEDQRNRKSDNLNQAKNSTGSDNEIKNKTAIVQLPINLDLRSLLRKYPIEVKYCKGDINQQTDRAAFLLTQIVDVQSLKKSMNLALADGFVSLHSTILQKFVKDYSPYFRWMIQLGIIECDKKYVIGAYSRKFRLGPKYRGQKTQEHILSSKALVQKRKQGFIDSVTRSKYIELHNDLKSLKIDNLSEAIKYAESEEMREIAYKSTKADIILTNKIKGKKSPFIYLDNEQLEGEIKRMVQDKVNSWKNSLVKIDEGALYFKQDNTSFRLHTSAISVKKELRIFFRINGQPLVSCDIKNSQPTFSLRFFLKPTESTPIIDHYICSYKGTALESSYKELHNMLVRYRRKKLEQTTLNYIDLVSSGKLYEFFAEELRKLTDKDWSREAAKRAVFDVLFCPPKFKSLPGRKVFEKHFPEVIKFFSLINQGYTMTKSQRAKYKSQLGKNPENYLARILQRTESQVVLDIICKELKSKHPHIPLIPLHDGIATTLDNELIVYKTMLRILEKEIGIKVNVEIEYDKWGIKKNNR